MSADQAVADLGRNGPGTAGPDAGAGASLHKLPAAVFLLHQAEEGRWSFPFASEALQRIFMIPAATLAADAAVVSSSIPPEDLAQLKRQMAQALEFGQTCRTRLRIRPPGVNEAWYEMVAAPEILPAGGTLWHGLLTDVTHQQRSQDQLRAQQRRWRQVARVADLGLVEFDPRSARLRLDAVACRHHGLGSTPAWMSLADWLELLAEDDRLLAHAALNSTPVPGATERLHVRLPMPSGALRTLELMLQQADDDQRLVGTCRVAEAARQPAPPPAARPGASPASGTGAADATAEAVQRHKREFMSRISHELRTPLNGVLGFVQLMAHDRSAPLPPQQQQRLEVIRQSGTRLMALIDQLLDVSGLEEGRTLLRPAAVDVHEPVRRCIERLAPLARELGITVATDLPPNAPPLLADRDAITRVLENLLANAIQYNHPGGRVQIHMALRPRQVVLAVEDTGRGMSEVQLSQLFDPFNRLGVQGRPVQGTGLGLVIARQLVQAMNGEIRVQSKPGVGTRVELLLPLADRRAPAPSPEPPAQPVAPQPPADTRKRILYIEDDEVNTLLMRHVVDGQPGWRLIHAASGADGLGLARSEQPDVILLDLHLPDTSGQQVLQALRADPATRGIPCVAVSADARTDTLAEPGGAGFDACWNKPIDVDEVVGGLRRLLASGRG